VRHCSRGGGEAEKYCTGDYNSRKFASILLSLRIYFIRNSIVSIDFVRALTSSLYEVAIYLSLVAKGDGIKRVKQHWLDRVNQHHQGHTQSSFTEEISFEKSRYLLDMSHPNALYAQIQIFYHSHPDSHTISSLSAPITFSTFKSLV
jgi:hypothetical protein